jgi:hypothetical protein
MVMSVKNKASGVANEPPAKPVATLVAQIRSLMAEERISSARELADTAFRLHPDRDELRLLREALYPGSVARRKLSDSSHRQNMEWLTLHQEEHRGKWVALLDGELVASDANLDVLMSAVSPLGSDRKPLVHHIREYAGNQQDEDVSVASRLH